MTIAKTIAMARQHLASGNRGAYARIMSGAVRAAMSNRAANAYKAAMQADGVSSSEA